MKGKISRGKVLEKHKAYCREKKIEVPAAPVRVMRYMKAGGKAMREGRVDPIFKFS